MIKRMVVATFLLFAVLLFMLPRTDEASKMKMVSAAMLMCSNDFRKSVAESLLQEEVSKLRFGNRCPDLIARLELDDDGVITLHGAQHGIVMELVPEVGHGQLHWSCHGTPAGAITSLCKP